MDTLLRGHGRGDVKVSNAELFFDLVFVFAITRLSHTLLEDLTLAGALRVGVLFMAVWWVWIYTTWVTNWLDPERTPVRLMLYALMAAGLFVSMAIPAAWERRALTFAAAYAAMQVGRTLFMLWALRGRDADNFRNFLRILAWLVVSAAFWIAGALVDDHRGVLWVLALAIEYAGPMLYFWTPGLGRSQISDWNVEGAHLAERCGLFVIIALGESVLITGATMADLPWTRVTLAAFGAAFAGCVAMWWLYFNIGAERAAERIEKARNPGRLARVAYTYTPLLIVGGIVASAAADELVLAHPLGHLDAAAAIIVVGGPALYLLGNAVFKRITAGWWPLSHLAGMAAFALLGAGATHATPLALGAATTAVLVVVAVWETLSLARAPTRHARDAKPSAAGKGARGHDIR